MTFQFIPIALACGHLLEGFACFDVPTATVECPEGCGMVSFVVEPTASAP